LHHAFPRRIQPATVLDRTKLQRIFHTNRLSRTRNPAIAGRFQLGGLVSA
jgi:hypothetical protein